MDDPKVVALIGLAVALAVALGIVLAVVIADQPDDPALAAAVAAGRLAVGMREEHVVAVWGEPDVIRVVEGRAPNGFLGLMGFDRETVWEYSDPPRRVVFDVYGRVLSWEDGG